MDSRDKVIEELRALVAKQAAQIEKLTSRISELELQLAKAKKDSTTSSKPPSSDIAKPKRKQRPGRPKKRRQGGQAGHERQLREPLPPERVDETIEYEIEEAEQKRLGLTPTGDFDSIQHIELPETPVHVIEHRLTVYHDADGNLYVPDCPELKGPIFGPRMLAMISWLKSVGHCSYSTIETWVEDVLQVPVSRGYLAKLCTGTISASLQDAYQELSETIPTQQQLGSDETSIKDNGKKHWIWCITAATFTVFHIAKTRSREVLEKLVGKEFEGYLNFDYFSAWHRRDEMSEEGFHRSMITHRDRFLELVRNPPTAKEAANLAARFAVIDYVEGDTEKTAKYDLSEDYFRFMFAAEVEPTNNHSEQQIRHCVIDRRITQGTRGEAGQRYHERMWTMIATCKKQNRSVFTFLRESITAKLAGQPAPSLLG